MPRGAVQAPAGERAGEPVIRAGRTARGGFGRMADRPQGTACVGCCLWEWRDPLAKGDAEADDVVETDDSATCRSSNAGGKDVRHCGFLVREVTMRREARGGEHIGGTMGDEPSM